MISFNRCKPNDPLAPCKASLNLHVFEGEYIYRAGFDKQCRHSVDLLYQPFLIVVRLFRAAF